MADHGEVEYATADGHGLSRPRTDVPEFHHPGEGRTRRGRRNSNSNGDFPRLIRTVLP